MKKIIQLLIIGGCLFVGSQANAQSQSDMKINEVLSINTDGFEDDYGHRSGWVELFNSSYGYVNIAGCYLSDTKDDLKKYIIPKGDILTNIAPRQHILFWADNQPFRGTFHISFKLNENGGQVYFVASDGRTILDSIHYPALPENASFGRLDDGVGTNLDAWRIFEEPEVKNELGPTPSSNNKLLDSSKALEFLKVDKTGAIMAITAMSVVFLALIFLYIIFKYIGIYSIRSEAKRAAAVSGGKLSATTITETSGEVYAAIAISIELYRLQDEVHDIENTILTMDKVARTYSPWSSKLYGLREVPQKTVSKK